MRGNMLIHWALYHLGLQSARTQLSQPETEALCRLARGKRCIVELGVFEGVTSHLLRKNMSPEGTLWGVDPFFTGGLGFSYGFSIANREVNRSHVGRALFIKKFSYEVIKEWQHPIDFLFIDADHSYEAVKLDWFDWTPHIVPEGIIALHDSRVVKGRCSLNTGPVRLVNELKTGETTFKIIEEVDTLTVFSRIK